MRYLFTNDSDPKLEPQIDKVLEEMTVHGVDTPEYDRGLDYLERLYKLKGEHAREPISKDTVILSLTNLMGILLIVAYEQKHVITTKALNQIGRIRT